MNNRERFSSRLGVILISAGCAVGWGNVWRRALSMCLSLPVQNGICRAMPVWQATIF